MKKSIKVFTFFSIVVSALFLGGCEIEEIPNTDTTPPEFTFRITGDGYDRTFDQDTDFSSFQLVLKKNQTYSITLTASDAGGVQLVQWFTGGSSYFTPETTVVRPWTYRTGLQSVVEWVGHRGNAYSGTIFEGNFRAEGGNIGALFKFYVRDFGGREGVPNFTSRQMNVYFSEGNLTGIIPL